MKSTRMIVGPPDAKMLRFGNYAIACLLMAFVIIGCGVSEASLADKKNYTESDPEYRSRYAIQLDSLEKIERYGYHYVVSRMPDSYRVRVFHPEKKTLTEDCQYSTPALTLPHGACKRYWDDGSIREQGTYQFGRKHGNWLESEPHKGKSSSGMYLNQRKEGEWTQLDTSGMIESIYNWHDDQRHGKFFLFDANGEKINEGLYRADTIVAELFKRPVIEKPYLRTCEQDAFANVYDCTEATLMQHIYSNLKYPVAARSMKIEGTAVVQWDVMSSGEVSNLRVPQSLSDAIEAECMRVFRNMPGWRPARKDGQPVKYTMSVPINFKL